MTPKGQTATAKAARSGNPARKRKGRGQHKQETALDLLPSPDLMSEDMLQAEIRELLDAEERARRRWACDRPGCDGLPHEGWRHHHARESQRIPAWVWTTWLLLTGRGWGKTRTAAEAVREWAKKPNQFIAVVAKNETLVREICFESKKSGLLAVIPPDEVLTYSRSTGNVNMVLKNGTVIRGFGGEVPDNLRGWAFDKAWADEYAAWNRHSAQAVMDMLWFCLREAEVPQVIISTTPKPLPHIIKLVKRSKAQVAKLQRAFDDGLVPDDVGPRVTVTQGHTDENKANLSGVAVEELEDSYEGTRLGDQELGGILLEDIEGALWKRWMLEVEDFRLPRDKVPPIERMVVAVDPATTTTETADESGLSVAGRSHWFDNTYVDQRPRGYVFHSETQKLTPMQTMRRAVELYRLWRADCIILEANNGGDYLATVLQMVDPSVPYRIVHATRDKRTRATPVAALYEQSRIHHVGAPKVFAQLEETMTTYVGAPESEEKSPDDLDALVWAMTDLFLDPSVPGGKGGAAGRDRRSEGRR